MSIRKITALFAAIALIGVAVVALPATSGADQDATASVSKKKGKGKKKKGKTYTVKVLDDYYSPIDVKAKGAIRTADMLRNGR